MRLSTVLELLLIFLFIAFAASRHIDKKHHGVKKGSLKQSSPSRYCACTSLMCNCCRDFSLPVVSIKGPGCAAISYLNGDSMRLTMSFGDRVLRNITLAGRRPRPVCMGLPGGVSKFCGRIYGIEREGTDQFKACLALELRALDDVEAALRVSCFKFGPQGVKLEPSQPIPSSNTDEDEDDEDDDDDYGLDDDDDDDDDFDLDDDEDDSAENDVDSGDYTGFSVLSDEFLEGFFGGESSSEKKKRPVTASPTTAAPVREEASTTTGSPPAPVKKEVSTTEAPVVPETEEASTAMAAVLPETEEASTAKATTVQEEEESSSTEDLPAPEDDEEEDEKEEGTTLTATESSREETEEHQAFDDEDGEASEEDDDDEEEEEEDEEEKERERALERFPGLAELLRKRAPLPELVLNPRSSRAHRRMRI